MELYKIKVTKDDGRYYYDVYLCWFYKRVRYERVSPTFKGFSQRIIFARAIEVGSVQEMKAKVLEEASL